MANGKTIRFPEAALNLLPGFLGIKSYGFQANFYPPAYPPPHAQSDSLQYFTTSLPSAPFVKVSVCICSARYGAAAA